MEDDIEIEIDAPPPVCVVCNRPFRGHEGHVSDDVEICDYCLHKD